MNQEPGQTFGSIPRKVQEGLFAFEQVFLHLDDRSYDLH